MRNISPENVIRHLDRGELLRRWQIPSTDALSEDDRTLFFSVRKELETVMRPTYGIRITDCRTEEDTVHFPFGSVSSHSLAKALSRSRQAAILTVTLGHEVDRYLRRAGLVSARYQWMADAVASAACEALCEMADVSLPPHRTRVSPGYGDIPLSLQSLLLSFMNAEKEQGISLTSSGLMIPQKSITAIAGLLPVPSAEADDS